MSNGTIKNKQLAIISDLNINSNKLINVSYPVNETDGVNKKYVDDNLSNNPSIYSFDNIIGDMSIGVLSSGSTLGIIYIENIGTVQALVNIGTTPTGNEINPYGELIIDSGEILTVTVNLRISNIDDTDLYINSSSWTNVILNLEWSPITYANQIGSGTTIGSGGFRGVVTKDSLLVSEPQENQWVQPIPQTDNTFSFIFDNYLNNLGVGISVNLSLENVKLRYDIGGYWVKESFEIPLSDGKTWVGNVNNKASEYDVITEWVSSEEELTDIGQKFSYQTQTYSQIGVNNTVIGNNYVFIENIDLKTIGTTLIISDVSSKNLLSTNIRLMILNTSSNPFTFSVGTNSTTYDNVVASTTISTILANDVYELILPHTNIALPSNNKITSGDLYFNITSASTETNTLVAHILYEGFWF